uniref:CUB domain-containing protein n=1 Tax=Panagrellus redivivus TaxID=6233 RepID=A0A7E4V8X2_PANRE
MRSGHTVIVISYIKSILETLFAWGFIEKVEGDTVRLDTDPNNDPRQVCPPDFKNGYHYWEFVKIPSGCEIKIIGATHPLAKFKLTVYILLGISAVILLISLGAVIFCLLRQHQTQESKRRGPQTDQ